MIFTGDDNNLRVLDFVNKPVFIGDMKKSCVLKNNHILLLCSFSALIRSSSVSKEVRFLPSSTFFIASIKRSRLAGELSRYSVVSGSRTSISTTWLGYVVLMVSINALSSSLVFSLYVVVMLSIYTQKDQKASVKSAIPSNPTDCQWANNR